MTFEFTVAFATAAAFFATAVMAIQYSDTEETR